MAIEAPTHRELVCLPGKRHAIDAAVARFATDALLHVNRVVEVDEIGQVVYPDPLNGLIGSIALANRLQYRRDGPHLRVAVHAGLCGWDVGER